MNPEVPTTNSITYEESYVDVTIYDRDGYFYARDHQQDFPTPNKFITIQYPVDVNSEFDPLCVIDGMNWKEGVLAIAIPDFGELENAKDFVSGIIGILPPSIKTLIVRSDAAIQPWNGERLGIEGILYPAYHTHPYVDEVPSHLIEEA